MIIKRFSPVNSAAHFVEVAEVALDALLEREHVAAALGEDGHATDPDDA